MEGMARAEALCRDRVQRVGRRRMWLEYSELGRVVSGKVGEIAELR